MEGKGKAVLGITLKDGESRTVSGNREWWATVPLCAVLTSVAKGYAFVPALSFTRSGISLDDRAGDRVECRAIHDGFGKGADRTPGIDRCTKSALFHSGTWAEQYSIRCGSSALLKGIPVK